MRSGRNYAIKIENKKTCKRSVQVILSITTPQYNQIDDQNINAVFTDCLESPSCLDDCALIGQTVRTQTCEDKFTYFKIQHKFIQYSSLNIFLKQITIYHFLAITY